MVAIVTWLTFTDYQICFVCRCYIPSLLSFYMNYHNISNESNVTGATSGASIVDPSRRHTFCKFTTVFLVFMLLNQNFCVVLCVILFNILVCLFFSRKYKTRIKRWLCGTQLQMYNLITYQQRLQATILAYVHHAPKDSQQTQIKYSSEV